MRGRRAVIDGDATADILTDAVADMMADTCHDTIQASS
jgi:hypothetical protein